MSPNLSKEEKVRRNILDYTMLQVVPVMAFIILLQITFAFDVKMANTRKLIFRFPDYRACSCVWYFPSNLEKQAHFQARYCPVALPF